MPTLRTPLIGGNWKMHRNIPDARSYFKSFLPLVSSASDCDTVVFPPFLDIVTAVQETRATKIRIGAQNVCRADEGAFTGEISGSMIKASGCSWVIVGHSERRRYFGETDETVLKKTIAALNAGLVPIVCIGGGEENDLEKGLIAQFRGSIEALSDKQFAGIVIAYEPARAIADGAPVSPEVAASAHSSIRTQVRERFGADAANNVRILYGGAMKPDDAAAFIAQPEIDGFLAGSASLDPVRFADLVNLVNSAHVIAKAAAE